MIIVVIAIIYLNAASQVKSLALYRSFMPHKRKPESAAERKERGKRRYDERERELRADFPEWPEWLRSDVATTAATTATASTDRPSGGDAEPAAGGGCAAGNGAGASSSCADSGSRTSASK